MDYSYLHDYFKKIEINLNYIECNKENNKESSDKFAVTLTKILTFMTNYMYDDDILDIYTLRYIYNFDIKTIASELDKSVGLVEIKLHKLKMDIDYFNSIIKEDIVFNIELYKVIRSYIEINGNIEKDTFFNMIEHASSFLRQDKTCSVDVSKKDKILILFKDFVDTMLSIDPSECVC